MTTTTRSGCIARAPAVVADSEKSQPDVWMAGDSRKNPNQTFWIGASKFPAFYPLVKRRNRTTPPQLIQVSRFLIWFYVCFSPWVFAILHKRDNLTTCPYCLAIKREQTRVFQRFMVLNTLTIQLILTVKRQKKINLFFYSGKGENQCPLRGRWWKFLIDTIYGRKSRKLRSFLHYQTDPLV